MRSQFQHEEIVLQQVIVLDTAVQVTAVLLCVTQDLGSDSALSSRSVVRSSEGCCRIGTDGFVHRSSLDISSALKSRSAIPSS